MDRKYIESNNQSNTMYSKNEMKTLNGIVQDGMNNANIWLHKFSDVYTAWLGQEIFPGSLNLDIGFPFNWNGPNILTYRRRFSLLPNGGERDLYIIPCTIVYPGNYKCWLWTTTTASENRDDPNIVELIAGVELRSELNLETGSEVKVEYPNEWLGTKT